MSTTRRVYKIKKTRKRRRRKVMFLLVPLLVIVLGASAYAASLVMNAKNVFDESYDPVSASSKRDGGVDPLKDNFSILFIGIDDSERRNYQGNSRSDALMLATFNKEQKSVKLLSIPRDSYVYIPAKNTTTKINAAHAAGGPKATMDTVEELFDIPVDYYVRMNFNAFMDVVDALGGIEVDVPYDLKEIDSKDNKGAIVLKEGRQTLNGEEALAVARTRKQDSDIQRGERQQEILKAIMAKGTSVGAVSKYTDVMEAIGDNMTTNLRFSQMKGFINYVTADSGIKLETVKLKGSDLTLNGTYYYQLDETSVEDVKLQLQSHLNLSPAESTTETESAQSAAGQ
ncbi:LCP family protein [Bacillus massiliglaciei]|uniref:LCP family protein n=1 Tax=Bacillus massiliglaciei TaxID=1816693 RepID=UPI000ADAC935|nr:LCP family protein [Bacillus massiliglaciei]